MSKKRVTMKDIAEIAGVSQSAVSMILNGRTDSFPQETVRRVTEAAENLQYTMKLRKTYRMQSNLVLSIEVQTANPYYAELLQGLDRAAAEQGIHIVAANTYHSGATEQELLDMAVRQNYLGVIFLYPADNIEAYNEARQRLPIITVCDKSSRVSGDIVEMNHFEAGAIAARHLISLGHRKIAVLSHTSEKLTSAGATRLAGILSEIRKTPGLEPPLILTQKDTCESMLLEKSYHYNAGYTLAKSQQIVDKEITGLICVNDLMAYGAMDALKENGYSIPEDYSVIGSDNILFSDLKGVSLTTIEYYPDIVAKAALKTLLNRTSFSAQGQKHSDIARFQVQCQPTLVIRGSTGKIG